MKSLMDYSRAEQWIISENSFNSHATELTNGADLISIELFINGEYFTLEKGSYREYTRELNLRTGEL